MPGNLGQRPRQLDAGRPAADHHERQQPALRGPIRLAFGLLEGEQDPAPYIERILQGLQPRRERSPRLVTEIGMRRSGRHDYIVVRDFPVGELDDLPGSVDRPSSASHTSTFRWRRRIQRIGDAMSPGESPAVAT